MQSRSFLLLTLPESAFRFPAYCTGVQRRVVCVCEIYPRVRLWICFFLPPEPLFTSVRVRACDPVAECEYCFLITRVVYARPLCLKSNQKEVACLTLMIVSVESSCSSRKFQTNRFDTGCHWHRQIFWLTSEIVDSVLRCCFMFRSTQDSLFFRHLRSFILIYLPLSTVLIQYALI